MIVLGDISGIQRYLFDVPEAGGGQARRLRARSFLIQTLAECAALRVLGSLGWPATGAHFLSCGAGKFILRGPGDPADIRAVSEELNRDLLRQTSGELRVALGAGAGGSEVADYRRARRGLQRAKATPWRPPAGWEPDRLILPPLGTPCAACRRAPAGEDEIDPDTRESRRVCRPCARTYLLGRSLPRATTLVFRDGDAGDFEWFGISGELAAPARAAAAGGSARLVVRLDGGADPPPGCPPDRFATRRLMAHVPEDAAGAPVWFTELAGRAAGDRLLAVLKADVDSLGAELDRRLHGQSDLTDYLRFTDALDRFFAGELRREIVGDRQWESVYTVFAGGDDLVMIGPWDVMFRFAGRVRELFGQRFPDLTLSAGLALFKPKRPVKAAVEEAERLLEQAKGGPKNQCAALGQVWDWKHHAAILQDAERLAGWVERPPIQMQRGWLHTLLDLAVARHGDRPDPLATARLAYHVGRNYRVGTAARRWADELVQRFDDGTRNEIRFLPAILRHALTATRSSGTRE